jgi:hypothetical protein
LVDAFGRRRSSPKGLGNLMLPGTQHYAALHAGLS